MSLVAIKDLRANPYRRIERYPIKPEKVAALRESYRTTGYWNNIVGRERDGAVQIAYGHHRLRALEDVYGGDHEVEVIVWELSDEQMLQIMARENLEVFGTSSEVEQETVRAVVTAAADDIIKLGEPPKGTPESRLRYAPSFTPGRKPAGKAVPYTTQMIGDFLGWRRADGKPQDKVRYSLQALELIEEGRLKESHFDGLTSTQARELVEKYRKVRKREMAEAEEELRKAEEKQRQADRELREQAAKQERLEQKVREAQEAKDKAREAEARVAAEKAALERRDAETAKEHADEDLAEERENLELREAEAEELAEDVVEAVVKHFGEGGGIRTTDDVADDVAPPPPEAAVDKLRRHAEDLVEELSGVLDKERDKKRVWKILSLAKHPGEEVRELKKQVMDELRALAERAQLLVGKLAE